MRATSYLANNMLITLLNHTTLQHGKNPRGFLLDAVRESQGLEYNHSSQLASKFLSCMNNLLTPSHAYRRHCPSAKSRYICESIRKR